MILGIHWDLWKLSPMNKGGGNYCIINPYKLLREVILDIIGFHLCSHLPSKYTIPTAKAYISNIHAGRGIHTGESDAGNSIFLGSREVVSRSLHLQSPPYSIWMGKTK